MTYGPSIDVRPALQDTTTTLDVAPPPEAGSTSTLTATVADGRDGDVVQFFDGETLLGEGMVSGGIATFTWHPGPADAPYSIVARYLGSEDYAPSESVPSTGTVAGDTTAPDAPANVSIAPNPVNDGATVTVTGEAEPYSQVSVVIDGDEVCTVTASMDGDFQCAFTANEAMDDELVVVTATDAAGNTSEPTTAGPLQVNDVTPPDAPVDLVAAPQPAVPGADATVSGNAEPGSTVSVKLDGAEVCNAVADPVTGAFSCEFEAEEAQNGRPLTATAMDAAGNVSQPADGGLFEVLDNTAPDAPGGVVIAPQPANDGEELTVVGTAEPGSTVVVTVDGVDKCTAVAQSSGTFSCSFIATEDLDGELVTLTATDTAGNISEPMTAGPLEINDVTPPEAPADIVVDPQPAEHGEDVTVSGIAEPGSEVSVVVGGTEVCTASADSDTGEFSCSFVATEDQNGQHVAVTATDSSGNTSDAADGGILDVGQAPDVTPPDAPENISVVPHPANHGAAVTVTGEAEPGSTVSVMVDGVEVCETTATPFGAFSCSFTAHEDMNGDPVTVTATDAAGNVSETASGGTLAVAAEQPPVTVTETTTQVDVTTEVTTEVTTATTTETETETETTEVPTTVTDTTTATETETETETTEVPTTVTDTTTATETETETTEVPTTVTETTTADPGTTTVTETETSVSTETSTETSTSVETTTETTTATSVSTTTTTVVPDTGSIGGGSTGSGSEDGWLTRLFDRLFGSLGSTAGSLAGVGSLGSMTASTEGGSGSLDSDVLGSLNGTSVGSLAGAVSSNDGGGGNTGGEGSLPLGSIGITAGSAGSSGDHGGAGGEGHGNGSFGTSSLYLGSALLGGLAIGGIIHGLNTGTIQLPGLELPPLPPEAALLLGDHAEGTRATVQAPSPATVGGRG